MQKKPVQQLLTKPMNRREFLAHLGAGTLALVGISGMIKTLSEFGVSRRQQVSGYGSSAYGGGKKSQ